MPRWAIIGAPDRDGAALPADDEGRFRRYARAWVGRVWLRLAPVLVALALLSGVAAPKTVALAAAVLVAGEALDGIVLWRLGGRSRRIGWKRQPVSKGVWFLLGQRLKQELCWKNAICLCNALL